MAPTATDALLSKLIDYAGLFPPASLGTEAAVQEYERERSGASAWMVDRFIVPASRLPEIQRALDSSVAGATGPLALSVILDDGGNPETWLQRLQSQLREVMSFGERGPSAVSALEIPLPRLARQRDTYDAMVGQIAALASAANARHLPIYAEIPRGEDWLAGLTPTMEVLARYRIGAKVRCGGVTADAFPSPEELAGFISAAVRAQVPFKATAGLHHPVRTLDPAGTGLLMHGFLNLLAATLVAYSEGADAAAVEGALGEEDTAAFRMEADAWWWRDKRFDVATIANMRASAFIAYGSCSIAEPVADLAVMGVATVRE